MKREKRWRGKMTGERDFEANRESENNDTVMIIEMKKRDRDRERERERETARIKTKINAKSLFQLTTETHKKKNPCVFNKRLVNL